MIEETFDFNVPTIWFAEEDIHDADEPYLPSLLNDSFLTWYADAKNMSLFKKGQFCICSKAGSIFKLPQKSTAPFELSDLFDETILDISNFAISSNDYTQYIKDEYLYTVIPILRRRDHAVFATFIYITKKEESVSESAVEGYMMHYRTHFYRQFEGFFIREIMHQKVLIDREASHRERLFLISKRLYDQINPQSVVREMLQSLEELYRDSKIHLFLSQDNLEGDSRVKPLEFRNSDTDGIVTEAFLEGKPCVDRSVQGTIRLAIPMNGKQAAYGVLCIEFNDGHWDELDLPAFMLIADTAGSAFENAKLYEQSNLLINELRLINEMAKRLNQSLKSREIFQFTTTELLKIFKADYCCLLQLDSEKNSFVVKSSNLESLTGKEFNIDYGFTGIVYRTKEAIITSDYWNSHPVSSELMEETQSRSLIASPIFVDGEVAGVILVIHKEANYFTYDNYKLLQVMSSHIGLAVTNATLHAEMRKMIITDNLTNLRVRHYLDEQIQRRQGVDFQGSLILVDIDYFKLINDTHGHQTGDQILIQVASIIKSSIRSNDIAARWGGEEIAIYLPNISSSTAVQIAERIRLRVETETSPKVTVSCGVSQWDADQEKISVESLFYRADMALYQSKNNGRNCINVG